MGTEQSRIRNCRDALTDAFEGLEDVEISEESLLRKPGPWGGERESLSYSKKQREVQDHGRETGGNNERKPVQSEVVTDETVPRREVNDCKGYDSYKERDGQVEKVETLFREEGMD